METERACCPPLSPFLPLIYPFKHHLLLFQGGHEDSEIWRKTETKREFFEESIKVILIVLGSIKSHSYSKGSFNQNVHICLNGCWFFINMLISAPIELHQYVDIHFYGLSLFIDMFISASANMFISAFADNLILYMMIPFNQYVHVCICWCVSICFRFFASTSVIVDSFWSLSSYLPLLITTISTFVSIDDIFDQ